MRQAFDDIRYGVRSLFRHPGLSVIALACLALGIGANSAIFSMVNSLLRGSLPFAEPERLIMVWQTEEQSGNDRSTVAPANYLDWVEQNTVFESMALWGTVTHNLTGAAVPRRLVGARVTAGFFETLGVTPLYGRAFAPDDDHADATPTVVLSHDLWRDAFSGDPDLVGRTVLFSEVPYTVVGVLPEGVAFPQTRDYWVPMAFDEEEAAFRDRQYLQCMGRLSPGKTLDEARSEMELLADRLSETYPDTNSNSGISLVPVREQLIGDFRPVALMLFGAVGLVLLIACGNVANLLLAKGAARHREMNIRGALGASRIRLVRQLMTESLVLSVVGGGLGILVAFWGVELLAATFASRLPVYLQGGLALNSTVLVFAVALSVVTGLLFGLLPALSASRVNLVAALNDRDKAASFGRGLMSMKSMLVVGEIALSMVLLVGAALFTQSAQRLLGSEPGFDSSSVISLRVTLPTPKYEESSLRAAFFREALEEIRALPDVEHAGGVMTLPFSGNVMGLSFQVEGRPTPPRGEGLGAFFDIVTPDYFETMRIPLLSGRTFTDADDNQAANVIIISESMATKFWPDEDPLGQRITFELGGPGDEWMTIVGVIGDVMHMNLGEELYPRMYTPHGQSPRPSLSLVARTPHGLQAGGAIRDVIRGIDPDQPIADLRMVEEFVAAETAVPRLTAKMTGGFALVALLLASMGLYGVMSFGVSQRTREIGIRMALGASRGDVVRYFLRHGFALTLAGVIIGTGAALAASELIASQLHDVAPQDPVTLILMALVLAAVAALATYLPARRATRIDPMVALRYE